jgi:hypothetical protein
LTIIKLTKKSTKKSMGRDEQTNKKQNKQKKPPGSGTIEFQSYFQFWCYSSILILVFKPKLYDSLTKWLGSVCFSFFQKQLLGQLLLQWGVVV